MVNFSRSEFEQLRPARLSWGLGRDENEYFTYVKKGDWELMCRRVDDSYPWNQAGWYIPYPKGWDEDHYLIYANPRQAVFIEPDDLFWCYSVREDNWYLGCEGDWIIPYPRRETDFSKMVVVHEW